VNETFVEHDADGYHVYRHVGDRHKVRVGPAWKTPRQAVDYAKTLDAAQGVSPIRSGEPFIAGPVAPLRDRVGSDGSPEQTEVAHGST